MAKKKRAKRSPLTANARRGRITAAMGVGSLLGVTVLGPVWVGVVAAGFCVAGVARGRRRDGAGVITPSGIPRPWLLAGAAAVTLPLGMVGWLGLLAPVAALAGSGRAYRGTDTHQHRVRLQEAHDRIAPITGADLEQEWSRWIGESKRRGDEWWVWVKYDPTKFRAQNATDRKKVEGSVAFVLGADKITAEWPPGQNKAWIRALPPMPVKATLTRTEQAAERADRPERAEVGRSLVELAARGLLDRDTLAVGEGREEPITVDLRACPHVLIAGSTGRGKTTTIRSLVVQLSLAGADLVLLDLKRTDYVGLALPGATRVSAASARPVLPDDPDELAALAEQTGDRFLPMRADEQIGPIVSALLDGAAEVEERYALAEAAGGWEKARRAHPDRFARLVYVIDEASTLTIRCQTAMRAAPHDAYGTKLTGVHPALSAVSDIARRGRECGVSLVIAQQQPSVDLLPGENGSELRNLCECRITPGQIASTEAAKMMAASDQAMEELRRIDSTVPGRGAVQVLGRYHDAQLYLPGPDLFRPVSPAARPLEAVTGGDDRAA